MKYTQEEKRHMEAILTAFQNYTIPNSNFDILYSEKCGYLYLPLNDDLVPVVRRLSADSLLGVLFREISYDVRDLFLCGEHDNLFLYPEEIKKVRACAMSFINQLPEAYQLHGKASLDFFLKHCNEKTSRF